MILYKLLCCKKPKWLTKLFESFIFNNFLRFFVEGYLEMFFAAFLNVYSFRLGSTMELISFCVSSLFTILLFVFPFMAAALIYDKQNELPTNEKYAKLYGTMYS